MRRAVTALSCLVSLLASTTAYAGSMRIAVASNFTATAKQLAEQFEAESGHEIVLLFGSSGRHVAQIRNGLRVDIFLAADAMRPQALEQDGLTVTGSRFTYAIGRLALWQPSGPMPDAQTLTGFEPGKLAIANPKLAPYGLAAIQVLESLALYDRLIAHVVRGENVTQAYQFAYSGHAELALVALAQIVARAEPHYWLVPSSLHQPIEQQAVLMRESKAAREFVAFMQTDRVKQLIRAQGYDTP